MQIEYNPHSTVREDATQCDILAAAGLIPIWIIEANLTRQGTVKTYVLERYQFPSPPMTGGSYEGDVYLYPEDPPLKPHLKFTNLYDNSEVWCYPHQMFAFKPKDKEPEMYRLD